MSQIALTAHNNYIISDTLPEDILLTRNFFVKYLYLIYLFLPRQIFSLNLLDQMSKNAVNLIHFAN